MAGKIKMKIPEPSLFHKAPPLLFVRDLKVFANRQEAYAYDAMLVSPSLVLNYPLETRGGWISGQANIPVEYKPIVQTTQVLSLNSVGNMTCASPDERFMIGRDTQRIRQLAENAMTFRLTTHCGKINPPFFISASKDCDMRTFKVEVEMAICTAGNLPDVDAFAQFCLQVGGSVRGRNSIQAFTRRAMRTAIGEGWYIPAVVSLADQTACVLLLGKPLKKTLFAKPMRYSAQIYLPVHLLAPIAHIPVGTRLCRELYWNGADGQHKISTPIGTVVNN